MKNCSLHQVARSPRLFRLTALMAAVLTLSACASTPPVPLAAGDILPVNQADSASIRKDVQPIAGPLSLNEAMARALKYNLERRSKMMEEALALNLLDVTHYDMLPKLVAQAGYASRNNDRISLISLGGAPAGGGNSISQDRTHNTNELGLTWNLLDYGLGYYNTQQQADRVLLAAEKRRKAMHLLMQDVRTAYWRAASAQKLRADVENTRVLAESALKDSRAVETERVRNPLDALRYQRQLLENLRLLEAIDQELSSSYVELATLINAPIGQTIQIAEPDVDNVDVGVLKVSVQALEEAALSQNADLREQHYNARIARLETHKTMARLFPNVSFNYAVKYDSDSYLVNRHWNETGLQASFNLFNILTGPSQIKLAEAGVALADQRRMATQVAVISQVHLARLQLLNARNQFERADAIYATDLKISELVRNREAALAQSQLDSVSNATAAILSLLRRYQALAQVQSAENRLLASIGLEPKIGSTGELSLEQLIEQLNRSGAPWNELLNVKPLATTNTVTVGALQPEGQDNKTVPAADKVGVVERAEVAGEIENGRYALYVLPQMGAAASPSGESSVGATQ